MQAIQKVLADSEAPPVQAPPIAHIAAQLDAAVALQQPVQAVAQPDLVAEIETPPTEFSASLGQRLGRRVFGRG